MKVDFYQGLLGVWQRKFQNEKILCYYAIDTKIDHVNEIIRV